MNGANEAVNGFFGVSAKKEGVLYVIKSYRGLNNMYIFLSVEFSSFFLASTLQS